MPLNTEYVLCFDDFDNAIVTPSRCLEKGTWIRYGLMMVRVNLSYAFEYSRSEGVFPYHHPVARRSEHRPMTIITMHMVARRR